MDRFLVRNIYFPTTSFIVDDPFNFQHKECSLQAFEVCI